MYIWFLFDKEAYTLGEKLIAVDGCDEKNEFSLAVLINWLWVYPHIIGV